MRESGGAVKTDGIQRDLRRRLGRPVDLDETEIPLLASAADSIGNGATRTSKFYPGKQSTNPKTNNTMRETNRAML
jgi:hypothetical protein